MDPEKLPKKVRDNRNIPAFLGYLSPTAGKVKQPLSFLTGHQTMSKLFSIILSVAAVAAFTAPLAASPQ